jgi:ABC-type sugar transport system ATPase subunit
VKGVLAAVRAGASVSSNHVHSAQAASASGQDPCAEFLVATGLSKRFGATIALRNADLAVRRGEIHSLVGANGSGKSTLLNILSGQIVPDDGAVYLDGHSIRLGSPVRALSMGIATVTQETTLVPHLSVAENVLLGPRKQRRWYGIDWRASHLEVGRILEQLDVDFEPKDVVSRLRTDQQQMVEIARALSVRAKVLLLDEATSALSQHEVEALFRLVRSLRDQGMAIIFVSHRMSELFELADRITILRDGQNVESGPIRDYDVECIVEKMVGQMPGADQRAFQSATERSGHDTSVLLSVRGLHSGSFVRGVSFDLAEGEAIGITGLGGSGSKVLLDAIFGAAPRTAGTVRLGPVALRAGSIQHAIANGIAYVPGDRKQFGLLPNMSLAENVSMALSSRRWRLLPVHGARERVLVRRAISEFGLVAQDARQLCSTLSGGNQQKLLIAKWLFTQPRVLLMDEPTRGVDVGAKREIYSLILKQKLTGLAMIVSSSEIGELLLLCDRILVMFRGEIVADLPRHAADEAAITRYAMGGAA